MTMKIVEVNCPEREFRITLDEGEFWDWVLNGVKPGENPEVEFEDEPPDPEEISTTGSPCPLCGSMGACAYDLDGRPLIHALPVDDDLADE
jgi:hypothetical protein